MPYLVGVVRLTPHQAVPVNLAISLLTVLAAIPTRLIALPPSALAPFLWETLAIALGAVLSASLGADWLRRLSPRALATLMFTLLIVLGIGLLIEAAVAPAASGFLPEIFALQFGAGLLFGLLIGAVSSVLGVAGGELIIPTLLFAFGVPIKPAGSLSLIVSLPTVLAGLIRHARAGAFADRAITRRIILPMGLGSAVGAIVGGLLVGMAPAGAIKVALGVLLIWSAWKVLGRRESESG